jgi:hypothetical protein
MNAAGNRAQTMLPQPIVGTIVGQFSSHEMDLAIRQDLQKALAQAISSHALIAISVSGHRILVGCDLTCYETHVAGTDQDGNPVELRYSEIDSVDVTNSPEHKSPASLPREC